jgi:uncharacterized membrane protein (UPF0127 family)
MWAWVGVALAFCGVVAWFVVASVALDAGSDDDAPTRGPVAAALRDATAAAAPFSELTEIALGVGGDCWIVVVADDQRERVEGLRGRRDTGPYDGMLFVFDEPTTAAFTMSGVPVPLDIGFYDAGGAPVSRRRMEPCPRSEADCPVYRAEGEFAFALETEAGGLADGALGACPS